MAKPELEFHTPDVTGWEQLNDQSPRVLQKILTKCPVTGNYTRLLKFERGADFSKAGVLTHEFWEEVWIVDGGLTDLTLQKTFRAGSYCCRRFSMANVEKCRASSLPKNCLSKTAERLMNHQTISTNRIPPKASRMTCCFTNKVERIIKVDMP